MELGLRGGFEGWVREVSLGWDCEGWIWGVSLREEIEVERLFERWIIGESQEWVLGGEDKVCESGGVGVLSVQHQPSAR